MIGGLPEFGARIVIGNICCTSVLIIHSFFFWRGEDDLQADRDAVARGEKLALWKTVTSIGLQYEGTYSGMRKMSKLQMENKFEEPVMVKPKTSQVMPKSIVENDLQIIETTEDEMMT